MKKTCIWFILIIATLFMIIVPCEASENDLSFAAIEQGVNNFLDKANQTEYSFDASGIVATIANIITTVGAIVVLGGLLYFGMKYMIATPDEAARIKSKLIGLLISGIVLFGAYGIWKITGNILENMTGEVKALEQIEVTPTPTPTYTPKATPTNTPDGTPIIVATSPGLNGNNNGGKEDNPKTPQGQDLGETYTSKFTIQTEGRYKGQTIEYWSYIPNLDVIGTYDNIPLIIFLHGSEEGESMTKLTQMSLPGYINGYYWEDYVKKDDSIKISPKAIVVAPRSTGGDIEPQKVIETVLHMVSEAKAKGITIDQNKISITGFSMGGCSARNALVAYPDFFSSAVLVSPAATPGNISNLTCPIRVYYGANENIEYGRTWYSSFGRGQKSNISFEYSYQYYFHTTISNIYRTTDSLEWMTKFSK